MHFDLNVLEGKKECEINGNLELMFCKRIKTRKRRKSVMTKKNKTQFDKNMPMPRQKNENGLRSED